MSDPTKSAVSLPNLPGIRFAKCKPVRKRIPQVERIIQYFSYPMPTLAHWEFRARAGQIWAAGSAAWWAMGLARAKPCRSTFTPRRRFSSRPGRGGLSWQATRSRSNARVSAEIPIPFYWRLSEKIQANSIPPRTWLWIGAYLIL